MNDVNFYFNSKIIFENATIRVYSFEDKLFILNKISFKRFEVSGEFNGFLRFELIDILS